MIGVPVRLEGREAIAAHEPTMEEVPRQIGLYKRTPRYVKLERPCLPGSGIRVLGEEQVRTCLLAFEAACAQGRVLKFIPAFGSASHLFKTLRPASEPSDVTRRGQRTHQAENDHLIARDVLAFMDSLARFAFYDDLKGVMARDGLAIDACLDRGEYRAILDYVVTERGLDYAALPTGLLKFHRYPSGTRTAFEEHLVEAAAYGRDGDGVCRLHFTVSPPHLGRFQQLLETVRPAYEVRYAARFQVGFSTQPPRTDTGAGDRDNQVFRPSGNGALIEDLHELSGDVVFIKNIDNVVPDDQKGPAVHWKKVLGGYLAHVQREVFRHLALLSARSSPPAALRDALHFARDVLWLRIPTHVAGADGLRAFLIAKLDRPLRVCGVVRGEDKPGEGPFWVKGRDGTCTLQIVATAQVDPDAPDQQAMLCAATYFNPVDLVCGVRDWRGKRFDLRRYIDPAAVCVSHTSSAGRALGALEPCGLWNAAMADWNTIFVEVPAATFRPVKTVSDLLG